MNNKICDLCTGCGACLCACPQKCITMIENKISERIPKIDKKKCVNCGVCKRVCPQNNSPQMNLPQKCYVAWSNREKDLVFSASGGIAVSIARYQLLSNNRVYGCDYTNSVDLDFFSIENENDLIKLQSSKYSQSKAYHVFSQIKNELKSKAVVFIGTPCQVAGLKNYLKKPYSNLILIDLVCHGTPPNTYLKEYINEIGVSLPVDKIRFRGEYNQQLTIWKNDKIIYNKPYEDDLYFSAFYKNKISMNACYTCKYAQEKRVSDITIADFWGLGELKKINKKSERPSLVLINTNQGEQFFNNVLPYICFEERTVQEAISGNGRLNNPPGKSLEAKAFQLFYKKFGFSKAVHLSSRVKVSQDKINEKRIGIQKQKKRFKKSLKRRLHI